MRKTDYLLALALVFAAGSCEKENDGRRVPAIIETDTFQSNIEKQPPVSNPLMDSLFNYFYPFFGLDSEKVVLIHGVPDSIKVYDGQLFNTSTDTVRFHEYHYDKFTIFIVNNRALLFVSVRKGIEVAGNKIDLGMSPQELINILGQPLNETSEKDKLILEYMYDDNAGEYFYFNFYNNKLSEIQFCPYID